MLLAPVKVEEFYLNPYIVLFHDVISDKEIEIVKQISIPKVGSLQLGCVSFSFLV